MGTLAYAHQVAVPIGKGVDLVDEERGVPLQNLEVVLNPHVRKLVLPPYHQTHRSPVVNTEPVPQTPVFTPEVEGQSSSLFEKEDEVEPPPLENALEISENFTPEIPEEPPEPKP